MFTFELAKLMGSSLLFFMEVGNIDLWYHAEKIMRWIPGIVSKHSGAVADCQKQYCGTDVVNIR